MNENDAVTVAFLLTIAVTLWWKHRTWRSNRLLTKWMDGGMRQTARMMRYDRRRR